MVLGVLVVLGVVAVFYGASLRGFWFRFVTLPRLARRHGWRSKSRKPWQSREGGELPGAGSVGWDHWLPDVNCEFVGTFEYRPVYGVEFSVPYTTRTAEHRTRTAYEHYSVVAVAASGRPFDGFHADGARAATGDPLAFYPDFVDWARDRRPHIGDPVRDEGAGMVSYSWQGRLTPSRITEVLTALTR